MTSGGSPPAGSRLDEEAELRGLRVILDLLRVPAAVLAPGGVVLAANADWWSRLSGEESAYPAALLAAVDDLVAGRQHHLEAGFTEPPAGFHLTRLLGRVPAALVLDLGDPVVADDLVGRRFRAAFEAASVGMVVVDRTGRVVDGNAAAAQLFGVPLPELPGVDVMRLADPQAPAPKAQLAELAAGVRDTFVFDTRCLRPDGARVHVRATVAALRDRHGRLRHFLGMLEDITTSRISEDRLRSFLANASDVVTVVDADGRVRYSSPAVEPMLGYRPDEVLDTRLDALVHPDDAERVVEAFQAWAAGEAVGPAVQYRLVGSDGRWRRVESVGVGRLDDPAVRGVIVTTRDLELRRAHEARVQAMVSASPVPIIELDREWRFRTWNRAAEELLGWAAEEMVGRPLLPAVRDSALLQAVWNAVRRGRSLRDVEAGVHHKDGTTIPVSLSVAPLTDDQGAVAGAMAVVVDVRERHAFESELAHQALHDQLTGLPNRALLVDRLDQALARARRGGRHRALALLVCDLDRFKVINDSLGHMAGDEVLCAVAERLVAAVSPGDTVARLGGDEFAVLCEALASPDDARHMAARLLATLDPPIRVAGRDLVVSMSVGINVHEPGDDTDAGALLRDADTALYRAKEAGRNRYQVFDVGSRESVVARLDVEADLRAALDAGELVVHYQPVVDLATGRPVGAEALVRWEQSARGLVLPGSFLDVAEEAGLLGRLGATVLDQAAGQAAAWRDAGLLAPSGAPLRVSINLTAGQLADPSLVATIESVLARHGAGTDLLAIEITESTLLADEVAARAVLARLRELGLPLLLDDFGTGYSSLAYLRRFPITGLKLDQSFVAGATSSPEDAAILEAVAGLGRSLRLGTVAEGVETAEQLAAVRAMGYDFGQGFYWTPAVPGPAATAWLAERSGSSS